MKLTSLAVRWLTILTWALVSVGCSSAPWTVVRQAEPNPFVSQRDWVVDALAFDGTRVDGEPLDQFLAVRDRARSMGDPRAQRDLRFDLARMSQAFVGRVTQSPDPIHVMPASGSNGYSIRASIRGISTGQSRGGYGAPAAPEAFLSLSLIDPDGRELDVVDVQTQIDPEQPQGFMNDDQRYADLGVRIGALALEYLATRVATIVH